MEWKEVEGFDMSWVDEIKELVPEYAKDIKLNLDAVINRSSVDYDYASSLALAAALATGNQDIVAMISRYCCYDFCWSNK